MFIQFIRCNHNRLILIPPKTFQTYYSLWCEIDVIRFTWCYLCLIDHVAEFGGLWGLEVDGVEGVVGEGGEWDESGCPVVGVTFQLDILTVHVIDLCILFLKCLVVVGYVHTQLSRMYFHLHCHILHIIIVSFKRITFMLELIIYRLLFWYS